MTVVNISDEGGKNIYTKELNRRSPQGNLRKEEVTNE